MCCFYLEKLQNSFYSYAYSLIHLCCYMSSPLLSYCLFPNYSIIVIIGKFRELRIFSLIMVAGCGNKCIKYVFWSLNFLLFVLGIAIVGLSIWIRLDNSFLTKVVTTIKVDISRLPLESFYFLLYVIIGFGAILLILGFLGCCGSACESVCTIGMYFILVFILFIIEIVGVVLYFVYKSSLKDNFINIWRNELLAKYNTVPVIRDTIDNVQNSLHCCGATGCSDWVSIGFHPPSCQCNVDQPGCATQIWAVLEANFIYVIVVCAIILLVELLVMIFSCILMSAVKEKRNA